MFCLIRNQLTPFAGNTVDEMYKTLVNYYMKLHSTFKFGQQLYDLRIVEATSRVGPQHNPPTSATSSTS